MNAAAKHRNHRRFLTLPSPDTARFRYAPGTGKDLIISFASIGRRRAQMPPDEFVGSVLQNDQAHCLFVSDINRSWLNDDALCRGLQTAVKGIQTDRRISRTITLGLSMGGFSALVCAALFPVDVAIAISPQFTVSQRLVPAERRWAYWRKQIQHHRLANVDLATPTPRHSFILHGAVDDSQHLSAFAKRRNRDHFVFPKLGHSELGPMLKANEAIGPLISAALEGNRSDAAHCIKRCGGVWRARYEFDESDTSLA